MTNNYLPIIWYSKLAAITQCRPNVMSATSVNHTFAMAMSYRLWMLTKQNQKQKKNAKSSICTLQIAHIIIFVRRPLSFSNALRAEQPLALGFFSLCLSSFAVLTFYSLPHSLFAISKTKQLDKSNTFYLESLTSVFRPHAYSRKCYVAILHAQSGFVPQTHYDCSNFCSQRFLSRFGILLSAFASYLNSITLPYILIFDFYSSSAISYVLQVESRFSGVSLFSSPRTHRHNAVCLQNDFILSI